MEEIKEFVIPSFLQGNSVDEIHKKMLDTMPFDKIPEQYQNMLLGK